MMHDDEQMETLLRQMQPRAPRPLWAPDARPRTAWTWAAACVIAAIALFAANVRFMPMASLSPAIEGPRLTIGGMRGLIEADPATLDRALLDASRSVLPDVDAADHAQRPFVQR